MEYFLAACFDLLDITSKIKHQRSEKKKWRIWVKWSIWDTFDALCLSFTRDLVLGVDQNWIPKLGWCKTDYLLQTWSVVGHLQFRSMIVQVLSEHRYPQIHCLVIWSNFQYWGPMIRHNQTRPYVISSWFSIYVLFQSNIPYHIPNKWLSYRIHLWNPHVLCL